jgi:hypothetical protein
MKRLRVCRIIVVLFAALMLAPSSIGCAKKKKPAAEATEEPAGSVLKPEAGGRTAQSFVGRGAQRQVNQQLLRNIGQYYVLYRTEKGRDPQNLQEFMDYLKSDREARGAKMPEALEKGGIVMVFNTDSSESQVLAYEKEAFEAFQNRLVLFRGGAVKLMTEPEFQAALKGQ